MLTGWRDFEHTLKTMDRLLDWAEPPRVVERRRPRASWPATNVFETKESFVVQADVPGLSEGDVSVSVEDDALVVRGERKTPAPEGYQALVRERAPVAFTRKLPLPARVDADGVTATLKDGVLTVTLPKAREAMPRQVAVKAL